MIVDFLDVLRADSGVVQNVSDNFDFLLDVFELLRVGTGSALCLDQLRSLNDAIGLAVEVLQNVIPVVEALATR